ncbi:hypothetical protein GGX14DRAFT_553307 [Mycena pura]|uniref:Uncharacterized protein n=1 Tax=Mycena pura TaxID=153505 RepID=A0AAD7E5X2_9AGAR|nr:hypothetical protein GGX14DRAFT_553307 [Mycena pura]
MYYEYYEPQQQYYDSEPDYDFELTSYEPEETYDDYDEGYGDDYDQPTACDVYAHCGDGNETNVDSYVEEELAHEGFEGEENLDMDFGHREQSDDERYVLPHYPEYEVDDGPVHAAENVVWQPPFDLDTARSTRAHGGATMHGARRQMCPWTAGTTTWRRGGTSPVTPLQKTSVLGRRKVS